MNSFLRFGANKTEDSGQGEDPGLTRQGILSIPLGTNSSYVFGDYDATIVTKIDTIMKNFMENAGMLFSEEYKNRFKITDKINEDTIKNYNESVSILTKKCESIKTLPGKGILDMMENDLDPNGLDLEPIARAKTQVKVELEKMTNYIKFFHFDALLVDHAVNVLTIYAIGILDELFEEEKIMREQDNKYSTVKEGLDLFLSDIKTQTDINNLLSNIDQLLNNLQKPPDFVSEGGTYGGDGDDTISDAIGNLKTHFRSAMDDFEKRREFFYQFITDLLETLRTSFETVKRLFEDKYKDVLNPKILDILNGLHLAYREREEKDAVDLSKELQDVLSNYNKDILKDDRTLSKREQRKLAKVYLRLQSIERQIDGIKVEQNDQDQVKPEQSSPIEGPASRTRSKT
jgi:hypothetical protein